MANLFKVKRIKQDGNEGHALINPDHIANVVPHKSILDASVVRFSNGSVMVLDGSLDTLLDVFDPQCEEVPWSTDIEEDADGRA